jgi:hypothetical protein
LGGGTHESLELAISQVRVLVKLTRFGDAHALADSLLSQTLAATPEESLWLACLAALLGQVNRSAELIRGYAPDGDFVTSAGVPLTEIPLALREEGLRLLVYASFGAPADSVGQIYRRIVKRVNIDLPTNKRTASLDALTTRARLFGFPVLEPPRGGGPLLEWMHATARSDLAGAQRARAELSRIRRGGLVTDAGADGAVLEARLAMLSGDYSMARASLAALQANWRSLGLSLLDAPVFSPAS